MYSPAINLYARRSSGVPGSQQRAVEQLFAADSQAQNSKQFYNLSFSNMNNAAGFEDQSQIINDRLQELNEDADNLEQLLELMRSVKGSDAHIPLDGAGPAARDDAR